MANNIQNIMEELKKPFHPDDIQWRIGRKAKGGGSATVLAYVDARAARERLDNVFGAFNWKVDYTICDMEEITVTTYNGEVTKNVKGFLATISVKDPESGEWISKEDGAGITDVEPVKGGISDAFKRACVTWGIGAYLYKLKEEWVSIDKFGQFEKPLLPDWALPEGFEYSAEEKQQSKKTVQYQKTETTKTTQSVSENGEIVFPRGKYAGKPVSSVTDLGYLNWAVLKDPFGADVLAEVKKTLEKLQSGQAAPKDDFPGDNEMPY